MTRSDDLRDTPLPAVEGLTSPNAEVQKRSQDTVYRFLESTVLDRLRHVARRLLNFHEPDVEDVIQNLLCTIIKADFVRTALRTKRNRETGETGEHDRRKSFFRGYWTRTLRNLACDVVRRRKREAAAIDVLRQRKREAVAILHPDDMAGPEADWTEADVREMCEIIGEALQYTVALLKREGKLGHLDAGRASRRSRRIMEVFSHISGRRSENRYNQRRHVWNKFKDVVNRIKRQRGYREEDGQDGKDIPRDYLISLLKEIALNSGRDDVPSADDVRQFVEQQLASDDFRCLLDSRTTVDELEKVKECAKQAGVETKQNWQSAMKKGVDSEEIRRLAGRARGWHILYVAAIATALVYHDRRISAPEAEIPETEIPWYAVQDEVPGRLGELFRRAEQKLGRVT